MGRPKQNLHKYEMAMKCLITDDYTLTEIAKKFEIKLSNLSKYLKNNLPKEYDYKKNKYKESQRKNIEKNEKAIEYILENKCVYSEATTKFGIKYQTLINHVTKRCSEETKSKLKEISYNTRVNNIRNRIKDNIKNKEIKTFMNNEVKSIVLDNFKDNTKIKNVDILDFLIKEDIEIPVENFINILLKQGKKIVRC